MPVDEQTFFARLSARLAPADSHRFPDESDRFDAGKRSRIAAVAALLRPAGDDIELLLIRRAHRAGDVWSGHVALPGGRRELADADPVATAQRETYEEVGLDLSGASLLGALPVLTTQNTRLPNISVQPFVWAVASDAAAGVSDEVAAAHWVAIAHLRHVDNQIEHRFETPDGQALVLPAISLGSDVLWGMTHRIVQTLFDAFDEA